MYIWGKFTKDSVSEVEIKKLYIEANRKISEITMVPIEEIIGILDQVGNSWGEKSKHIKLAQTFLEKELSFSPSMIKHSLSLIPLILNKDNLKARLTSEIADLDQLDHFVQSSSFNGKIRAQSLGVLTHYSAGNVFLGFLDSLVMGLLTKNVNIIKLSSGNHAFPEIFLKTLLAADKENKISSSIAVLYWKGGDEKIEKIVKQNSHGIMAWGGEEMVKGLKKDLPPSTKLIDYGPKISFSVISKKAFANYPLREIARKIVFDLTLWDQAACASPQNLFLEDGIDEKKLMKEVAKLLINHALRPSSLSADEYVEIQKEVFKAKTKQFLKQGHYMKGADFLLHFENSPELRNSPLNRTLIIKKFKNIKSLSDVLRPNQAYLQSCSFLVTKSEELKYQETLSRSGVKRFSELGTILFGKVGAPHDGRLTLVELLRFIPVENNQELLTIVQNAYEEIPFYHKHFKSLPRNFDKIPLLNSADLSNFQPNSDFIDGHIYSSGGTSGAPKYSYYSREEFNLAVGLIARGLSLQGVKPGDKVANLFVAGNLWSSFIAIEKALEELKTIQLSIGGLAEKELIVSYLTKFRPTILVGLPTLLIDLAELCLMKKVKVNIRQIYYAGEKMPTYAHLLFKKVFSCEDIRSAGYASVDAGPIGYQCAHSAPGEHHLFSDYVHLEIINHEAVVTTKYREIMPIIKLKTGDRVTKVTPPCPCGSIDQKFLLQGRLDNLIHLWGCRLPLDDIEIALAKIFGNSFQFQIVLQNDGRVEKLVIIVEARKIPSETKKDLWKSLQDVKKTHEYDYFNKRCELVLTKKISRIGRTGKIKKVIDKR